jgi:hypothetical protein
MPEDAYIAELFFALRQNCDYLIDVVNIQFVLGRTYVLEQATLALLYMTEMKMMCMRSIVASYSTDNHTIWDILIFLVWVSSSL